MHSLEYLTRPTMSLPAAISATAFISGEVGKMAGLMTSAQDLW